MPRSKPPLALRAAAALLAAMAQPAATATDSVRRPNIVFLIADASPC